MNPRLPLLALVTLAPLAGLNAKPPPAKPVPRPSPAPPAPADGGASSLLRWLLVQNGGPGAAAVPWPEIVFAASGRQITPLDPAAAADGALLARLGAALDALLPQLNRPDSSLRAASPLTAAETAARIADELRTVLPAAVADTPGTVLRWSENPDGQTCYLVVASYPVGGKGGAVQALSLRAADLASQITTDGKCLLVGIEHNGKSGRDLALLNWEAVDLARVSLRCAVTFEADTDALHTPGATLADGRRGRD